MFNKIKNGFIRDGLRKLVDAVNNFTDTPKERLVIAHKIKGILHYVDEEREQQRFAQLLATVIPTPFIDGKPEEVELYENAIKAMVTIAESEADMPLIHLVEQINNFLQKLESELK